MSEGSVENMEHDEIYSNDKMNEYKTNYKDMFEEEEELNENKNNNVDIKNEEEYLKLIEEGWIDLTKDNNGGVLKKIIIEGNGETPSYGSKVICHYVGTLESNGKIFDSSRDKNEPFQFTLDKG